MTASIKWNSLSALILPNLALLGIQSKHLKWSISIGLILIIQKGWIPHLLFYDLNISNLPTCLDNLGEGGNFELSKALEQILHLMYTNIFLNGKISTKTIY